MNLFSIAKRNIIQNFKNYLIYFISQIFSIMVFYIFCTLFLNPEFYKLSQISSRMASGFRTTAIIVVVFSTVFIWYSNNFFIRTRKKEIGLYSLLGMSQKQIGRMLFFENMILGLFSLLCGIFFGTIFSKLFSMMLTSFMGSVVNIKFIIVPNAIYITIIAFIIIFLISSFQSYSIIYRFKLIELFSAQKEGEKAPKFSYPIAFTSLALLISCYITVLVMPKTWVGFALIPITVLVVLSTYGIFHNFIMLIIRNLKKNKNFYYKDDNLITISQIFYRIKSNATVLATIAIITAMMLSMVGAAYSLYKSAEIAPYRNNAYSFIYVGGDNTLDEKIRSVISEFPKNKISYKKDIPVIEVDVDLKKFFSTSFYGYDKETDYLISQKTYNEILKQRNSFKSIKLQNSNECIFITATSLLSIEKYMNNPMLNVGIPGYEKEFKVDIAGSKILEFPLILRNTIVVKDEVFDEFYNKVSSLDKSKIITVTGISVENYKSSRELTERLSEIIPQDRAFSSFYKQYEQGMILFGQLIFIGLFLGVLFLMATGSIIYFKQLNDANENKYRYEILQKIGLSFNEIRKIVLKNLMVIFIAPFVLGLSHSLFALGSFSRIIKFPIKNYVIFIILMYFIVYIFYFFITFNSYIRIVTGGRQLR